MDATSAASQSDAVATARRLVVDQALRQGGSLLVPDSPRWRPEPLGHLADRLRADPPPGTGFTDWWAAALSGAPPAIVQLAAELLAVHLLFPSDVRGATKRRLLQDTLALSPDAPPLPDELATALDRGIAATGVAFKLRRRSQLRLLIDAARDWWRRSAGDRERALTDPWTFKPWLGGVPHQGAYAQREALLHLAHPHTFEPITSVGVKRRIVAAFSGSVPAGVDDVDVALQAIRRALEPEHGRGFSFADPPLAASWR